MKYVLLVLGHRSFFTGKTFIVPISEDYTFTTTYRDEAKNLGLSNSAYFRMLWLTNRKER